MSNENLQSNDDQPRKRRRSRSKRGRRKKTTDPREEVRPLARFSELSAPNRIIEEPSGDRSPREGLQSPRSEAPTPEKHLGSRESDVPRATLGRPSATAAEASETISSESPVPRRALLDAAAARRLAVEARERERASRAALEQARREFSEQPIGLVLPDEVEPERPESMPPAPTAGWQRRALVSNSSSAEVDGAPLERSTASERDRAKPREVFPAPEAESHEELRRALVAARAEIVEFRSTLSIARETTLGQKEIISELLRQHSGQADPHPRAVLEPDRAAPDPRESRERHELRERHESESKAALEVAHAELERLRKRIARQQNELDERGAERAALERTIDERDALLAERSAELDNLRDRFEAQDRALDSARREYEGERRRHSESLEILARLRATLDEVSSELPTQAIPTQAMESVEEFSAKEHASLAIERTPAGVSEVLEPVRAVPKKRLSEPRCGALFDAWQDDQIRRQFGPLGIDTFVELLRAPLSRRSARDRDEQRIVLLGRGAWSFAARLTEGLVANGSAAFTIHVADTDGPLPDGGSVIPTDSPVRDYLCPLDFPADPDALGARLDALSPSAILSRDFLSHEAAPEAWLACFERSSQKGACLLFSERTGIEAGSPSDEMAVIGERIWELMPERYTRLPDLGDRIPTWSSGFEASVIPPANQLIAAIRERFQFEIITQFGFLAEPFLSSPISANFDPKAPRDLRFLHQVADLDDRKIEAGLAPALHLVALVDPLSQAERGE